jgi:hypothetical protein
MSNHINNIHTDPNRYIKRIEIPPEEVVNGNKYFLAKYGHHYENNLYTANTPDNNFFKKLIFESIKENISVDREPGIQIYNPYRVDDPDYKGKGKGMDAEIEGGAKRIRKKHQPRKSSRGRKTRNNRRKSNKRRR